MGKRFAIALPFLLFLGLFTRFVLVKEPNSKYEYFACREAEIDKFSKALFLIIGTSHVKYFPVLLKDEDNWAAISTPGGLFGEQSRLLNALEKEATYTVVIRPLHKLELHLPIQQQSDYFAKGVNGNELVKECSKNLNRESVNETMVILKYFTAIKYIYQQLQRATNPFPIQVFIKSFMHKTLDWELPITANDAISRYKAHKEMWDLSRHSSELNIFLGSLSRRVKCVVLIDSPITDIYESYLTQEVISTPIEPHLDTGHGNEQRKIFYISNKDLGINIPDTTKYYSDADHLNKNGSTIYLGAIKRAMRDLKIEDSCI